MQWHAEYFVQKYNPNSAYTGGKIVDAKIAKGLIIDLVKILFLKVTSGIIEQNYWCNRTYLTAKMPVQKLGSKKSNNYAVWMFDESTCMLEARLKKYRKK